MFKGTGEPGPGSSGTPGPVVAGTSDGRALNWFRSSHPRLPMLAITNSSSFSSRQRQPLLGHGWRSGFWHGWKEAAPPRGRGSVATRGVMDGAERDYHSVPANSLRAATNAGQTGPNAAAQINGIDPAKGTPHLANPQPSPRRQRRRLCSAAPTRPRRPCRRFGLAFRNRAG